MVDLDSKTILIGMMVPLSLYTFKAIFGLWRQSVEQINKAQQQPIYNLQQLINARKGQQISKSDLKLVKVVTADQKKYSKTETAMLNEVLFAYPSRKRLRMEFVRQANFKDVRWVVRDMQNRHTKCKVKGMGAMMDPVVEVDVKYVKDNDETSIWSTFFKTLWGSFAFAGEIIFSLLAIPFIGFTKSHVFFEGPEVGKFLINMKIAPNMGLVLLARLEDNDTLIPQAVANSRQRILDYLRVQQNFLLFLTIVVGVASSIMAFHLYRSIKKAVKVNKQGRKFLELEDCPEDKACVVCMTNCRNIIFQECLHMSVCHSCFETLEDKKCPVCKAQIVSTKNVYEIEQIV